MPPHGQYGKTSNVRWVHDGPGPLDGHWEKRCDDCQSKGEACWWELTLEFWDPRTMQRCRACDRFRRRRSDQRRAGSDRNTKQRRYWAKNRDWLIEKQRARRAAAKAGAPA